MPTRHAPSSGLQPGLLRERGRNYPCDLRTASVSGGSTQPVLDSRWLGVSPVARWLRLDSGLVIVQAQITFPLTLSNFGVGDAYLMRLPFPISRRFPKLVKGSALAYQALQDPSANMLVKPCAIEPGYFADLPHGELDHYIGFKIPYYLQFGTATVDLATTTVNHACPWTPREQDFRVTPGNITSSANSFNFPFGIRSITATTFDITNRATTGAGTDITMGWRLRSAPPAGRHEFLGPLKPWTWSYLYLILAQFVYIPA